MKTLIMFEPKAHLALSDNIDLPYCIDLEIHHDGPQSGYGSRGHVVVENGPRVVFTLSHVTGVLIYQTEPADATPYLHITDEGFAEFDTTFDMAVNSIAFQALLWMNDISVETRTTVMGVIAKIKQRLSETWPNNILAHAKSDIFRHALIADALTCGTKYHVFESKYGVSEVWCKRGLIAHRSKVNGNNAITHYTVESRWTHLRKIPMEDGSVREVKESVTYSNDYTEKPKGYTEVISDMAEASRLAAGFGKSTPAV